MKTSVENKVLFGLAILLVALVGVGCFSYLTTNKLIASESWVSHTYEVIAALESGQAILTDAETAQRSYLLTGEKQFLRDSQDAQAKINGWLTNVRKLVSDNPQEEQRLDKLKPLISQRLMMLNERIRTRQQQGLSVAAQTVATRRGKAVMDQIWRLIADMHAAEVQLLLQRQQTVQTRTKTSLELIFVGGVLTCALGLVAEMILWRDLKLRRRVEEVLRENEERFRLMIESVKDYSIIMLNPEGKVMIWNTGAERIKGYQAEEIVGQHFSRFYPEDAVRAGHPEKELLSATAHGRFEDEGWRVRKDGTQFWASVVITAVRDEHGRLLGFAKVTRDMTGQKQAEQMREERDRFFELSRDLICIADFDGYFKTVNPAWQRTLGLSHEELFSQPFIEFVHPADRTNTLAEVERLRRGGETVYFENRYRAHDGSYHWLAWNSYSDRNRKLIYANARDITEQKLAEQKIHSLNDELTFKTIALETANKELEAFSYSVSHDLRAPLRHVHGFVDLLTKQSADKLDERGRRYLKIIADSAHQMGALIDDLLVFSRMSRADLRLSKVAMDSLVHEAIDAMQMETAGRRIVWKVSPLPEVEADASMLRQVWVNLIANAVKYSRPRNPAEIEIGCNLTDGEFIFYVKDNGVGFDMEYSDKLFGVFQRLHRSDEFEGTGIGLANVRRIVSRHGGRAWAEGKVDAGAIFYFSLLKTEKQPI
jgi:PAS domain S-box-containing protein